MTPEPRFREIAFEYLGDAPISDELHDAIFDLFEAHGVTVEGASDYPTEDR